MLTCQNFCVGCVGRAAVQLLVYIHKHMRTAVYIDQQQLSKHMLTHVHMLTSRCSQVDQQLSKHTCAGLGKTVVRIVLYCDVTYCPRTVCALPPGRFRTFHAVVSKGSIVFELSVRYILTITPTAFRIAGFNIKACNPTLSWTVSPEAADESVGWEQLPILPSH